MDKTIASASDAVKEVFDSATIMIGGFGLSGNPENFIAALRAQGTKNLTIISNNAGVDDFGIGTLIRNGQVKKMVMSYGGECQAFEQMALDSTLQVEWNPQGTLAERIRAGGAGIGGFFTPTGYGTPVAEGKETRQIDGRWYVLESPLKADFALIKAWKADTAGNLVYRKTARNFNQVMATAAARVFAEVEYLVAVGEIDGDAVHTPCVYVDKILKGPAYAKPIEKVTVRKREAGVGA